MAKDGRVVTGLYVQETRPEGFICAWNKSEPNQTVAEGDIIVRVNDKIDEAAALARELQVAPRSELNE